MTTIGGGPELGAGNSFVHDLHLQYMTWMLQELPGAYECEESNRVTLAYFALSALDVLDSLDQVAVRETIDWVYGMQVLPSESRSSNSSDTSEDTVYGFRGSPSIGIPFSPEGAHPMLHDGGNLAMTYSALAILAILGDDFSRVARVAILKSLRALQHADGSFSPVCLDRQRDMRFVFCAASISVMLNDWSGMDRERAVDFILKSQAYDGGFSLSPGLESHGGATYCAIATLKLITQYDPSWPSSQSIASLIDLKAVVNWCLQRQGKDGGFQGRTNKPSDTCYSFWIGGCLEMLNVCHLCNKEALCSFLLSCQSKWGGLSKHPEESYPDLLHSYYGICGFSLVKEPGLEALCYELGLTHRTACKLIAYRSRNTSQLTVN